MAKAFNVFRGDFYDFWGVNPSNGISELRKLNLLSPSAIRDLKSDNIDGRQWNSCKHLNNKI